MIDSTLLIFVRNCVVEAYNVVVWLAFPRILTRGKDVEFYAGGLLSYLLRAPRYLASPFFFTVYVRHTPWRRTFTKNRRSPEKTNY